ncbi:MAG: hypothetical protein QOJ07_1636 [Thermoleophilaceae bacterium]|nr:hypothetical protein [Thermoleophilaceae bacterium]
MVHVRLLGSLAIEVDGVPREAPASRRAQALLGWLVLHPGAHARGQLAGRFWPDVLDASARASLRSAVWALRRALGPGGEAALGGTRDELQLRGVTNDAAEFERLCAAGDPESALALCRGDLLAGLDDDWVHAAREEHRLRMAAALEQLVTGSGDPRAAAGWARRWTALDPLSEAAHRALMEALAASGERSAALAVYAKLRERFRLELGVSPSAATRAAYDALRAAAEEPTRGGDRGAPPLIGRRDELRRLGELWERARSGEGGVVVLTGEGGIGKTRLATELQRRAAADGARVATGAALDLGGAAPFGLWAELLRDLARDLPAPAAGAAWPGDVARLAPDVARALGRAPAPPSTPELERARLFEAAVELWEHACADRPLLVLIEDLHVADAASIELTAYVGRRIAGLRALVVVTRRAEPRRIEADALAAALARRGALLGELVLGPLPPADVGALVRAVAALPDADVARVTASAEGNALLAVESARAAAAGETGPAASLRTAVRAQVGTLDPGARLLAEIAAIAGRELDRREIAALDLPRLAEAATAVADSGLLSAAGGRIGYRHALMREAVYADLPDPRRSELHETLARALAAAGAPGDHRDAEVARHLLLAGLDERAVDHLAGAARHARGVGALPEAAGYLREAAAIAPGDPALWLDLSEVEAWAHHGDESEAAFERAAALMERGDQEALAGVWLRRARWFRGPVCDPARSLGAYERALELLDRAALEAPLARAEALAGCAWCEASGGDADIVDGLLERVHLLLAGRRPDELLTHDVGAARQFALIRRGEFRASYAPGIAAAEAAMRAGRPEMAYGAWGNAASAAAAAGELDRALEFAERSLTAARSGSVAPLECVVLAAKSQILARAGRLEEAQAVAVAEYELAERLDRPDLVALAENDRGLIALASGDFEAAQAQLGVALDARASVSRPLTRIARAEALARLGRADDADAELRAATLEPVGRGDFPDTLVPRLTRVQGLAALARGDRALAERRLTEAIAGWERRAAGASDGQAYLANLVDLGRPAVGGLVEPVRELERTRGELMSLREPVA